MQTIKIANHSLLDKVIGRIADKDLPADTLLSAEHLDGF